MEQTVSNSLTSSILDKFYLCHLLKDKLCASPVVPKGLGYLDSQSHQRSTWQSDVQVQCFMLLMVKDVHNHGKIA